MSIKLFNETLGVYMPAFFCMELNIPFDFKRLEKNNDFQMSTFIHEYIHYIQDITTTYGYMNLSHSVNMIQAFLHKSGISKERLIKLPIQLDEIENAEERDLQMSIFAGDSEYLSNCHIDNIIFKEEELYREVFSNDNDNFKNIELHYNKNGKSNIYNFGSMCIMESMAYLIESHIFPDQLRVNEFPYNTCEMICDLIYPEFGRTKKNIVALCDVALMTQQPGVTFLLLLRYMKKVQMIPEKEDDIYKLALNNLKPNYIEEEFNVEIINAREKIDFLYPENQVATNKINKFFKEIINEADVIRKSDYSFISKIMAMDRNTALKFIFSDFINKFALPVIKDKESTLYMYNDEGLDLTLVVASRALYDIFFNNKPEFKCYMHDICKNSNLFNKNCLESPWKMSEKE